MPVLGGRGWSSGVAMWTGSFRCGHADGEFPVRRRDDAGREARDAANTDREACGAAMRIGRPVEAARHGYPALVEATVT